MSILITGIEMPTDHPLLIVVHSDGTVEANEVRQDRPVGWRTLRNAAASVPPLGRLIDADAIEELSKPRWIPVTERLPRMWEEVMLRFPNNQAVGFHDGDSGWAVFSGDNLYTYVAPEEVHPTHWMPLPEPPKER